MECTKPTTITFIDEGNVKPEDLERLKECQGYVHYELKRKVDELLHKVARKIGLHNDYAIGKRIPESMEVSYTPGEEVEIEINIKIEGKIKTIYLYKDKRIALSSFE